MIPCTGLDASESGPGNRDDKSVNTVTATAIPSTHPARNPTLVARARGESSIKIAAMMGIGLIATPSANGRICPMTSFMDASR